MKLQEFFESTIGKYITQQLRDGSDIHTAIASIDTDGSMQEILAADLATHCTPQEIEQYVESDMLYQCTPYGQYLQSCIQYATDNADLIIANLQ